MESNFNLPNQYSNIILLTKSDFILINGLCAIAITAYMSFRTALSADFEREYRYIEFLWKQRPGIGGVAVLPPAASQIVKLDGYHMIIEHRMRDKHQNANKLMKKTEFYERLEQKQANQAEDKEGFSFLDKETYEVLPLTRWLDKSGHPNPGHPELSVERAAEIKIQSKKGPVPLNLLLRSNLVQQELSCMNINILSLLDKTVQVTPQVMRLLGGLLERELTRDDPERAAAMASLTINEKVKIMPVKTTKQEK